MAPSCTVTYTVTPWDGFEGTSGSTRCTETPRIGWLGTVQLTGPSAELTDPETRGTNSSVPASCSGARTKYFTPMMSRIG